MGLATAALLEYYYICPAILDLILPMLLVVALGICSATLKRIGRYLKQTSDRRMAMNPSTNICKIDSYPDANFAGMNGHEKPMDPSCVKSCTVFFITFTYVPILWKLQLQMETALSTMEVKIIALLACCKDLFPIIDMVESVTSSVNLPIGETTMKLSVHEDNHGALVLAKTLPPQFTP